ncbi:TlpA family protein disulfide reductase [Dysgonomonas sp. Marseille-P4677]|uniref:TlpA family protein disulfide reductase n=1 Tax=Dysgonomonas sp. Marseille-P4677 TaxID=2364790 RepID=UPI001913D82C|nr:TlpA disulfide reductase family protein [Dysgonomonas sp. Marseille-P4677]MBK5722659.1 TlpA family protein disulfide reductase [Dysgonomonas sp. Marseille-P4677]
MKKIATFLFSLFITAHLFSQVENNYQFKVKVGDIAPDFEMSLPSGEKVKLSSLRGKVVMLQFTASWCGVCRKEMPHIESEIWQRHKDNPNFALYGIDREEPAETILKFAEATGVTYPIGLDPKAEIFSAYAEKEAGITRNIVIDKDGKIVMLTRLYKEEEFNKMVKLIDSLLAKK